MNKFKWVKKMKSKRSLCVTLTCLNSSHALTKWFLNWEFINNCYETLSETKEIPCVRFFSLFKLNLNNIISLTNRPWKKKEVLLGDISNEALKSFYVEVKRKRALIEV